MSFFDKKSAANTPSKKRAGGAAAGMAAAAVAAGGAVLASEAGAAALANVASFALNDDGSVTVTYADGSTATYAAGTFEIIGDQVHIGSSGMLLAGGTAGLALLAALALAGGDEAEASSAAAAGTTTAATTTSSGSSTVPAASGFTATSLGADYTDVTATALTASADVVTGTDGNDLFSGIIDGSADTVQSTDVIDGGAGDDALQVTVTGTGTSATLPIVVNVEELILDVSGNTGNPYAATLQPSASNFSIIDATGATTNDLQLINVADGTTVAIDGLTTGDLDLTVASGATSVRVVAEDIGTDATNRAELSETTATDVLTTLTIEGTMDESFLNVDMDALTTLNIEGDKKVDVTIDEATLTTVDASSNNTGGVDVTLGSNATAVTSIKGSGVDDIFEIDGVFAAASTVDLGEGSNTLDIDVAQTQDMTVTGGSGVDTVEVGVAPTGGTQTYNLAAGADVLDLSASAAIAGSAAKIVADLGAADAAADTVKLNTQTENTDQDIKISNFTVGAGGDVLDFGVAPTATVDNVLKVANAAASTLETLDLDANGVVVISGGGALADAAVEANVVSFANDTNNFASVAAGGTLGVQSYVLVADADSTAVYSYVSDGNAGLLVAELTLIAELSDIDNTEIGSLTFDNFAETVA